MKIKLTMTAQLLASLWGVFAISLTDGNELVQQAANNVFHAAPFRAAARLTVNLFQQHSQATGQYFQLGHGSGSARLEFVYGESDQPQTVLQVCHQGFYYRYQSKRDQTLFQVADLRRVAEVDDQRLIASPQTWMTTGGISSLLDNLSQNFVFDQVSPVQIDDTPVWHLRGTWNQERLRQLLTGQVKSGIIQDRIRWERLPKQLPHSCELWLGNDDYFPLFPYRIIFFQLQDQGKRRHETPIVTLELYEVDKFASVRAEHFEVHVEGTLPTDLTHNLVERIRIMDQFKRSAKQPTPNSLSR